MSQDKTATPSPIVLRRHRPGDLGYITHRHAVFYWDEYQYDDQFESVVARIAADFLEDNDPATERCWIAERDDDGQFLGCIMLVRDRASKGTAKLRILFVEPAARGMGLGSRLVGECVQFAREVGYERVVLWTQSELVGARRLYKNAGFKIVDEVKQKGFGSKSPTTEVWELVL